MRCRLCGKAEGKSPLIKYSVRHYAHADCALNRWGDSFFDRLTPWQVERFPALAAFRAGYLDALKERISRRAA